MRCLRQDLNKVLKAIAGATSDNGILPVMGCVMIDAVSGTVEASNTLLYAKIKMPIQASVGEAAYVINHKSLHQACLTFTGDVVEITGTGKDGSTALISCGRSKVMLMNENAKDMTVMHPKEGPSTTLSRQDVMSVSFLAGLAADDLLRPAMGSVYLGEGRAIAGDGSAMAILSIEGFDGGGIMIPRQAMSLLQNVLAVFPEVETAAISGNTVTWEGADLIFSMTTGNYPDVGRVFKACIDYPHIVVAKAELEAAIRLAMLASQRDALFKALMTLLTYRDGVLTVSMSNDDESSTTAIDAEGDTTNETICVNGPQLLTMLKHVRTESVMIRMSSPRSPILVQDLEARFEALVMPILNPGAIKTT